jgi:hypothetical protein
MIGDGNMGTWTPHPPVLGDQAGKSLWARNLVDDVPIDVEQIIAVIVRLDDMPTPNLVVKRQPAHPIRSRLSLFCTVRRENV